MNRSQFLKAVAERAKAHRRDVEHVWENALGVIADSVKKGQDVSISGFGKFRQRVIKARPAGFGKNPFTGETIRVAARPKSVAPKFIPAKALKEYVAGRIKSPPRAATKPMALAPAAPAKAKKSAPKKAAKKGARKAAPKKAKKGKKRR